jgi:zinc protease
MMKHGNLREHAMKMQFVKTPIAIVSTLTLATCLAISAPVCAQDAKPAPTQQTAPAPTTTTPWGHVVSDVAPDPSIRFGVLPNGMKYAIQQNATPKNSAVLRMQVNVGSLAEVENERGLAHFLEHMAFNGSKNVPEGDMVKILQREGLSFGADTNASTSFEETVYKLDLPETDDKTIDTGLFLLRETAGELTISPEAVDRERGVVLSEKQTRNSPGLRRVESLLKFALPDTPVGDRLPIGTEDVLKNAPAARIKSFYQRYYRPENTTLVVVGDFDVNAMEAKIKTKFADWKGVGPAGGPLNRGKIDTARPFGIGTFSDPASSTEIEMAIMRPFMRRDDTIAFNNELLQQALISSIMGQRFQKLALASDAKIRGGSVSFEPLFNVADQTGLSINAKEGEWADGVAIGEQELRRALQFGFTQGEVTEQIANLETAFRNAATQADTRRSVQLADAILGTIWNKTIVSTPSTQLAIFEKLKPGFTVDALNSRFRTAFSTQPSGIHISTKETIADPQKTVMAALMASSQVAVSAPEQGATKAFAYDNFGKPGKVVANTLIADLGIRTVRFANGVKLNIKKTDFEKGKVRYALRFGGGMLDLPQDKGSFGIFMNNMGAVGGLKEHSYDDLKRILAGKSVSSGLTMGEDSFGTSGTTTPEDLSLQMKLSAAYLIAPGYRTEADTLWQNAVQSFAAQLDAVPQAVAGTTVPRLLASGDTRFGIGSKDELAARKISDMQMLIEQPAATAPIEIAIVGDVDEQAAIDGVAKSFGTLPKRAAKEADYAKARTVVFPKDPAPLTLTHKGAADQGMLLAYWPTTDDSDQKSSVTREVADEIFGLLLLDEIREKLGATYSPSTYSSASSTFKDYGFIAVNAVAEPAKMDVVSKAIKDITKQMRDTVPSDDVLLRARKPLIEQFDKLQRENGGWLGLAGVAQSKPERLDRWRKYKGILEAVTPADIQVVSQKYLTDAAKLEIRIVSDKLK